jgi:hypothetical protein
MDLLRYIGALMAVCNNWTTPVVYALFNVRIRDYIVDTFGRKLRPLRWCDVGLKLKLKLPNNADAAPRTSPAASTSVKHESQHPAEQAVHVIGGVRHNGSQIAFIAYSYKLQNVRT